MTKRQIEDICFKEIVWQRPYKLENVWEALMHLAATVPRGAVVWEIRSSKHGVSYFIGADKKYIKSIEAAFKAHGEIEFHSAEETSRIPVTAARQLKIGHPTLSLKTDITQAVTRAGLAALAEDKTDTGTVIQIILGRAHAPSLVPEKLADPHTSWLQVILGDVRQASAETRKTVREKAGQQSFDAAIRIGVAGGDAGTRINNIISAFRVLESVGVRIYGEDIKPDLLGSVHVPWHFPAQLSVKELANFLLLPFGEEELPCMPKLHPRRTLPPNWYKPPINVKQERAFAVSMDAAGPKRLSISPRDSLEHCHIIGPTGSGKSTAMLHLILSDINAGRSVLVLDPKADLVTDILMRISEERTGDVVIIDPSDSFNPLAFKEYGNPSLLADTILSVFKEIWSDSWGVRIADILNAALLTLTPINGATLLWIPPLLLDENFRRKIVAQVKDKVALVPFWLQFDSQKKGEQMQQIEPVLNKLRQFLLRPSLRSVLGQAAPRFSLMELFTKRRIVLVPLNKGLIGSETARLLGSLIIGLTWTLALSRAKLQPERRHIVEIYIDELQDYLSLPTDLSDALAQARGLGVGMTLAHQYRDQLPPDIRSGIDANTRNKIVFGLQGGDAKATAAMAPGLSAEDFIALPRYQIYASFQSGGRNTGWVQGQTLPPPPALQDAADLRAKSQAAYGIPAERVEEDYLKIFTADNSTSGEDSDDTPIGRRKRS